MPELMVILTSAKHCSCRASIGIDATDRWSDTRDAPENFKLNEDRRARVRKEEVVLSRQR